VGDAADPSAELGGDVTVANGCKLRGHGTIDGDVTNDGVVFPGGSIGILTVNGNFTQNSDGTLNIEVTLSTVPGTGFDQLQVTGSASLAGTLAVQVDTPGNPHIRDTEMLGSFSAGETALAAPVGAFTPGTGVELTGHGPWRRVAAWGGQFGSAASAESFSLEGRYVW
jgi:hypothetical protein